MTTRRKGPFTALVLALLAWAPGLLAGFSGTDVFIPASARAAGVAPAQFYSTLWVTNLSTSAVANVQLKFFQRDVSNTTPITVPVAVNPGETKKFENVVQTVFGLPSASGAIRVQSDQEILASSRTYNLPPGSDIKDANGLFFAGIPQTLAIGAGETAQMQGVSQGGSEDYRYNFGFVETAGSAATVRITVRNADGSVLGTKDYPPLQPYEAKQFGVADAAPGIATANGRVEATVLSGSGRVLFYATAVANGSQDSIGYEMSFKSALLSPAGVTSLNGLTGALTLTAGSGISLSTLGGTSITISATGVGGGLSLPYTGSANTGGGNAAFAVGNTGAGPGLLATSSGAAAIIGSVPGTLGSDRAVYGIVTSTSPASYSTAVRGANSGTAGFGIGVWGSQAGSGWGVYGESAGGYGVYGHVSASGIGVYADSPTYALRAQQGAATGFTISAGKAGVWGDSIDSYGVFGSSNTSAGITGASATRYGVQALGFASGANGAALFAYNGTAGGYAAYLTGTVNVSGSLSKSSGSFKIDHPLDPENKYLYHSFVESPDMKNIYDGVVVLDGKGEAVVTLPDWFSALNRDFRYQLTCIGGYAPVYVAREVETGSFAIAGGRPGLKVSWQLTGIRQDAWAEAHRIPVEEEKEGAERGTYIHPELFGQPEERSVDWARNPGLMRELRENRRRLEAARAEAGKD